jgi:hypothetical protein
MWRKVMRQMSLKTAVIGGSAFACAALLSFGWSEQRGVSLSVDSAQARVGRPLTPVSVAGVARRQNRRAVYGAGAVGAAAVGTAAAVGWRGGPYTGAGYNADGPYYGGRVLGAGAPYYGAYGNNYDAYAAYNGDDTGIDADAVAYCTQRFRSYDPASGTYLGYDGLRHACPAVE